LKTGASSPDGGTACSEKMSLGTRLDTRYLVSKEMLK
jgi:hypothetical protein